jgi:hypothetical protein
MSFVRFVVTISDQWLVTITKNAAKSATPRQLTFISHATRNWPLPPVGEAPVFGLGGIVADVKELAEIHERIQAQAPHPDDECKLGSYLFVTLLGNTVWAEVQKQAVDATGIEIELRFPRSSPVAAHVGPLPWERMHAGGGFLTDGAAVPKGKIPLVITRSSFVRFVVTVDAAWSVRVTRNGQMVGNPRQFDQVAHASRVWPLPPKAEHAALLSKHIPLDPDELGLIRERIAGRNPVVGDVGGMGDYLFSTLLGEALWSDIQKDADAPGGIELALKFAPATAAKDDLARLHWEMMRDPAGFMARGFAGRNGRVLVVITRLVPSPNHQLPPVSLPPRALFIVGSSMDDPQIRAGAEFFGLIRQVHANITSRSFHPRVVTEATVPAAKAAIASFKPDLVYFICHGTTEGELEFRPDTTMRHERDDLDPPAPRLLGADDLVDLFTLPNANGARWLPTIVVLSACHSGLVGDVSLSSPLAARLVGEGVPVVVGMGGRVADQTCRLFTRSFGEALCAGMPLVEAAEIGRRAAFEPHGLADTVCDWALPVLYLRENEVGSDFAPTSLAQTETEEVANQVATALRGFRPHPCMAARLREFECAYANLREGRKRVVTVVGEKGYGRSRLLHEIAVQSLRDGHLPVLVSAYYLADFQVPKDLPRLFVALADVLERTASFFGQKAKDAYSATISQLDCVHGGPRTPGLAPDLRVSLLRSEGKPTVATMVLALRHDLQRLLKVIRALPNSPVTDAGRTILLIDDLEQLPDAVIQSLLAQAAAGEFGLGLTAADAIPVVVAFCGPKSTQTRYEDTIAQLTLARTEQIVLEPFKWDTEYVIAAHQQVLLHPHHPNCYAPFSERRWVIQPKVDPDMAKECVELLRTQTMGTPEDFNSRDFYKWVQTAASKGFRFLAEANDDDVLNHLRR